MLQRKIVALVLTVVLLVSAYASAADAVAQTRQGRKWRALPGTCTYNSDTLSCKVGTSGTVNNVRVAGQVLVGQMFLHGRSISPKTRFFQGQESGDRKLEMLGNGPAEIVDGGTVFLRRSGVLRGTDVKDMPRAAEYSQEIILSPMKIECRYKVKTLVAMSSKSGVFITLIRIPVSTLMLRGFRQTMKDGKTRMGIFPKECVRNAAFRLSRCRELRVVLANGHLVIAAGEDTCFSLSDSRAWGGRDFRIDIGQNIPWTARTKTIPAGTTTAWSFSISYVADSRKADVQAGKTASTGNAGGGLLGAKPDLARIVSPRIVSGQTEPAVSGVVMGKSSAAVKGLLAAYPLHLLNTAADSLVYGGDIAGAGRIERTDLGFYHDRLYKVKLTFVDDGDKGNRIYAEVRGILAGIFGKGVTQEEGTFRQETWKSVLGGKLAVKLTWEEDPGYTYVSYTFQPVFMDFLKSLGSRTPKNNEAIRLPVPTMVESLSSPARYGGDIRHVYHMTPEPLYKPLQLPARAGQGRSGYILGFEPREWRRLDLCGVWKIKRFPVKACARDFRDTGMTGKFYLASTDISAWKDQYVPWGGTRVYPSGKRKRPFFNGVTWFARDFNIPQEWRQELAQGWRVILRFYGVFPGADVWVSGKRAGPRQESRANAFEFDVTDKVAPGTPARVVLRNFVSRKGYRWRACDGIWQPVRLLLVPPIYARHVLVNPRLEPAGLEFRLMLLNHAKADQMTFRARLEPFARQHEKPMDFELGAKAVAAGESTMDFSFECNSVKTWSLEHPHLYLLTVFADNVPVARTRFGFRTFTAKGDSFYLNGRRIKLMGTPTWVGTTSMNKWGCNNGNAARRALYAAKAANVNFIRPHCGSAGMGTPTFLNLCDEVGMLVYDEFYYITDYRKKGRLPQRRAEYRQYVLQHHNHPAVVMWDHGGNEIYSEDVELIPEFTWYYKLLKQLDLQQRPCTSSSGRLGSSRIYSLPVVEQVDFADNHCYPGYSYGSYQQLREQFDKDYLAVRKRIGDKPYINCEYGMPGDGHRWRPVTRKIRDLYRKQPWGKAEKEQYISLITAKHAETGGFMRGRANWASCRDYVTSYTEISRRYAEFARKFLDIFRIQGRRIAGGHQNSSWVNLLVHSRRPDKLDQAIACIDFPDPLDRKLDAYFTTPGFYVWRRAYSPVFVGLDFHDTSLLVPGVWNGTIHMLNDSPGEHGRVMLVLQLSASDGRAVLQKQVWRGRLQADAHLAVKVFFKAPANMTAGDYRIELYLLDAEGERLADNRYPLRIAPRAAALAPLPKPRAGVALYDSQQRMFGSMIGASTSKVLQTMKVQCDTINDFKTLSKYTCLIIGSNSIDQCLMSAGKIISDWVKAGGRVLCFEQKMAGPLPFLPEVSVVTAPGATFSELLVPSHPIFQGIPQAWFNDWNGGSGILFRTALSPLNIGMLSVGPVGTGTDGIMMTTAAYSVGRGEIVLCQFDITGRVGRDVVATRLARNLLEYVLVKPRSPLSLAFESQGRAMSSMFLERKRAVYIDLSGAANSGYNSGSRSDTDMGDFFAELPPGAGPLSGAVPFFIIDPARNNGRGCIVLRGARRKAFPAQSRRIEINRRLRRLFVLHACQYAGETSAKAPVYTLELTLDSGQSRVIPMRNGREIGDWWKARDLERARVVFTAGKKNLYATGILLDEKGVMVRSIVLKSGGGATPIIFALTGESAK